MPELPRQPEVAEELGPAERKRGRRLAIASHPAGMTHRTVFTEFVPTLALLHLGAGETLVGLQRAFEPVGQLLQLPTLRAVARVSKRNILVAGQLVALAGGVPLLFFGVLGRSDPGQAVPIVLAGLALTSIGIVISQTVWFPILRGYQEPDRVGRFFAMLRTGWHLTLILYFLGAQYWLARHPGSFTPLFALGFAMGVVRVALISRLPERSERTGEAIRVGEALALLRRSATLRRYLFGVVAHDSVRSVTIPFAIAMMRRAIGFSEGEVMITTIAFFAGGLVSLYPSGRLVDRLGPRPIFRWTAIGTALLLLLLLGVSEPGPAALYALTAFFFGLALLNAGFGLADTHVLFQLAPAEAPSRVIVVAIVVNGVCRGLAPLLAGIALELMLARGVDPLDAYHGLFAVVAVVELAVLWPLRGIDRDARL